MIRALSTHLVPLTVAFAIWISVGNSTATAATVWSGLTKSFTRADSGPPTLPENQDRITDNVWLTRDSLYGIYNIAVESGYDQGTFLAPADTEWATDLNNPGETIAASNWQALTNFTPWREAFEGGSFQLPMNLMDRDAVLHLISDDIYLDIRFTGWTVGGSGFSYLRAVPEPATIVFVLSALVTAALARGRRAK